MKSRNYSLDLLRYIAMFLIVLYHVCSHWFGANIEYLTGITGAFFLTFPLITGYFYNGKYNIYKMITYFLELVFYSVVIAIIFGGYDLSYTSPLSKGLWWYASAYFMVLIFMPLFNTLPKKYVIVISLLGAFISLSIVPALTYSSPFEVGDGMSFIFIFFMVYLGRFLSTIKDPNMPICIFGAILCLVLTYVINQTAYYNLNSPYIIFASIFIFYIFKNLKLNIKISSRFAWPIYLIHCHPLIWNLFEGATYNFSFGKCLIYAIFLFIICFIASIPFTLLLSYIDKLVKKIPKIIIPKKEDNV